MIISKIKSTSKIIEMPYYALIPVVHHFFLFLRRAGLEPASKVIKIPKLIMIFRSLKALIGLKNPKINIQFIDAYFKIFITHKLSPLEDINEKSI